MSSAGGGSGIGGHAQQGFAVLDGGRVQLDGGKQVDLTTAEGLEQAQAALSVEQLAELQSLMSGIGFKLVGDRFVPADAYGKTRSAPDLGPTSTAAGLSAADSTLIQKVFVDQGLPNPYNANTTPKLAAELKNTPELKAATSALGEQIANPNAANQAKFQARFAELRQKFPHGNVMETLFLVFRESIQQTNEDKKYFLIKLQEYNQMAEGLSKYLEELVEASQRLSAAAQGQKYPEKVYIPVQVRTFDLSTVGPDGKIVESTFGGKSKSEADADQKAYNAKIDAETQAKLAEFDEQQRNAPADSEGGSSFDAGNQRQQIINDGEGKKSAYGQKQMGARSMDRAALNDTIKTVESMQETVRNKRQMASTAFQNFDQKSNQLYNLMSSVLKSMNEMRSSTIRNML